MRITTNVLHGIDRRTAAENFATWPISLLIDQIQLRMSLRNGFVLPIDLASLTISTREKFRSNFQGDSLALTLTRQQACESHPCINTDPLFFSFERRFSLSSDHPCEIKQQGRSMIESSQFGIKPRSMSSSMVSSKCQPRKSSCWDSALEWPSIVITLK
jgi:hypothetical protein